MTKDPLTFLGLVEAIEKSREDKKPFDEMRMLNHFVSMAPVKEIEQFYEMFKERDRVCYEEHHKPWQMTRKCLFCAWNSALHTAEKIIRQVSGSVAHNSYRIMDIERAKP
jgi:hypothetical protein